MDKKGDPTRFIRLNDVDKDLTMFTIKNLTLFNSGNHNKS